MSENTLVVDVVCNTKKLSKQFKKFADIQSPPKPSSSKWHKAYNFGADVGFEKASLYKRVIQRLHELLYIFKTPTLNKKDDKMAAYSHTRGHKIIFYGKAGWKYCDNKKPISDKRPCKHCHNVPIGTDGIDSCIQDLIKALNESKIKTIGSCCGHGKLPGVIVLSDGRELIINKAEKEFKAAISAV